MMMVPFLIYILGQIGVEMQLSLKLAIATSMSTIVFTSLASVRAHHKAQAVRWDLVKGLAPGIILGSLVSSAGIFAIFKGATLAFVFEAFVFFSATQLLINKKPKPTRQMPQNLGMVGAGGTLGLMSGLVGAGGGFISVPFMIWCNVTIKNAVATSAALGFPIALANTIGYMYSGWSISNRPENCVGYIWIPGMVLISLCSVLTAPYGARAAHSLPIKHLTRIFAFVLYMMCFSMLYKSLTQI